MQPIKDLKMEHDAVQMTLRILDEICQRIEKSGQIIDFQHLNQLLEFFKVFVDKCHHGKEEELLFPALENVGVSNRGGPIEVLLHEHQQGREYVQAMNAALDQYTKGDRTVVNEFVKTAKGYINLLNQHIDKENGVLFPLAEKHLSEQEQEKLWEGFEMLFLYSINANAHCDTLDGPVVESARHAIATGDVTPVLKWVAIDDEQLIRTAFQNTIEVRKLGGQAQKLADMYFFETLVRIHRTGEGASYTGLKPGAEVDPAIALADKALENGSVDKLVGVLTDAAARGIRERFRKALETKKHADESVAVGREFVEAYVIFTHYVEGLHASVKGGAEHHEHQ